MPNKMFFAIGKVLRPQGVLGEVKTEIFSDDVSRIIGLDALYFGKDYEKIDIETARTDGKIAVLKLVGVKTCEAAEAMRNFEIYLARDQMPPLAAGEYYLADLPGLKVLDSEGADLGIFRQVLFTGATNVYCVDGEKPFRFAAVAGVILNVDTAQGVMVLDAVRLEEVAVYE